MAALERVCDQHGIFKPTYPMEKMTLAELEHAASGPHRFVKWMKTFPSSTTEALPSRKQVFHFRKRENSAGVPDQVHEPEILRLVPGGRYLVTAGSCLCLWDLGYSSNVTAKPFPLATLEAPHGYFIPHLETIPSSDGKDILILVWSRSM